MSSRRSALATAPSNGGFLATNVQSDLVQVVLACQASYLFDPTVLPLGAQTHAVKWAGMIADLTRATLPEGSVTPAVFNALCQDGSLIEALSGRTTHAVAASLKASLFQNPAVKEAAAASTKTVAAFCTAVGQASKTSINFKQVCRIAAQMVGVDSFDLRKFVMESNPNADEKVALDAIYTSHSENVVLQATILVSLLQLCVAQTPEGLIEAPIAVPPDTIDRLRKLTDDLLSPLPSQPRKKAATAPPKARTNAARSEPTSTDELLAQIRSLKEQLTRVTSQPTAIPASPTRDNGTHTGVKSPAPSNGRRHERTIELDSSDSSSWEEVSDEGDDNDATCAERDRPSEFSVPKANYKARTKAHRLFTNPANPGTSPPFTLSTSGTYANLRDRAIALPSTEHQVTSFPVSQELTACLLHTFNTLCQTRLRGGVPSVEDVLLLVYHRTAMYKAGVSLIDINGIPHHFFRSRKPDATSPPSIAHILNPSDAPELDSMGETLIARHIFPVTPDHWKIFMRSAMLKAVSDPVHFQIYDDAPTGQARVRALEAYHLRFRQLIVSTMGPAWRDHRHHISLWALLLIFHLGRWTHATVMRKLTLLLDNFEREWETHWAQKARDPTYLAHIFPHALELLDYRCPKGHRGHCEAACDVCDRSPTATDNGEDLEAHKRAVDQWHRTFTVWSTEAKKRGTIDISHKAYEKEVPYPKTAGPKRPAQNERQSWTVARSRPNNTALSHSSSSAIFWIRSKGTQTPPPSTLPPPLPSSNPLALPPPQPHRAGSFWPPSYVSSKLVTLSPRHC